MINSVDDLINAAVKINNTLHLLDQKKNKNRPNQNWPKTQGRNVWGKNNNYQQYNN